ncbi:hypothetical protein LCGC14_2556750, partial [marine sediment metagenome]
MAKAKRNTLIGGLLAAGAVVAGVWYFFFRDDRGADDEIGIGGFEEEEEEIGGFEEEEEEVGGIEEAEIEVIEIDPIIGKVGKPLVIGGRKVIDLTTS